MASDVDTTILGNSICRSCVYRMSRIIAPFNFDYYDFSDEELEEIEDLVDQGMDTLIEEHMCLLLKEMLDCKVYACNFHKDSSKNVLNSIIENDRIFSS